MRISLVLSKYVLIQFISIRNNKYIHHYMYSQTCIKRPPLGYTKSSFLIQGVLNRGDKDNQMASLGDTKSGHLIERGYWMEDLLIQVWLYNQQTHMISTSTLNKHGKYAIVYEQYYHPVHLTW